MRSIVQTISVALLTLIIGAPLAAAQSDEADRIKESVVVITEILTAPDKGVPAGVLSKAEGVAVFPGTVKGAFILRGEDPDPHRGCAQREQQRPERQDEAEPSLVAHLRRDEDGHQRAIRRCEQLRQSGAVLVGEHRHLP